MTTLMVAPTSVPQCEVVQAAHTFDNSRSATDDIRCAINGTSRATNYPRSATAVLVRANGSGRSRNRGHVFGQRG